MFKSEESKALINYGPCQFPTFWFCYERVLKRREYKPEIYWTLVVEIFHGEQTLELKFGSGKINSKNEVKKIFEAVRSEKLAKVLKVNKKKERLNRPSPMNSIDLISMASDIYGFESFKTMALAENLYSGGLISYPRTESRNYTNEEEITKGLKVCSWTPDYSMQAKAMIRNKEYDYKIIKRLEDHPPITPVASRSKFEKFKPNEDERKILDLIIKNFYASVTSPPEFKAVDTKFSVGSLTFAEQHAEKEKDHKFELFEHNIRKIYKLKLSGYEFKEKDEFLIKSIKLQKWQKAPMEYISESELIKEMEKNGIGTDGTIPKYIKKIMNRKFVYANNMNDVRRLVPTALGEIIAEIYQSVDDDLIKPDVRKFIEECCNKISKNDIDPEVVKEKVFDIFKSKLQNMSENFDRLSLTTKIFDEKYKSKIGIINNEVKLEKKRKELGGDYLLKEIHLKDTIVKSKSKKK